MHSIMLITFIGLGVGVMGTGLGGLIAFLVRTSSKRYLSFILGITSGLMLAVVCFDLLPEAFELGQLYIGIAGILAGVVIIIWLGNLIPERKYKGLSSPQRDFIKAGILMGLGIAMHNFPEGLAIGSGFMATKELGVGISIVIALHNIPEGISMATPMNIGGMSKLKALGYTILAGIPMGIGAFVGAALGELSQIFTAFCLSFAAGTMLYITCGELIPKSQSLRHTRMSNYGLVLGFVLGILISNRF